MLLSRQRHRADVHVTRSLPLSKITASILGGGTSDDRAGNPGRQLASNFEDLDKVSRTKLVCVVVIGQNCHWHHATANPTGDLMQLYESHHGPSSIPDSSHDQV